MVPNFVEAIFGFLEHAGDVTPTFARRSGLPSVGTQLCALQAVRLNGRDLRSLQHASGFVLVLPRRAMVRVERYAELDGEGLWVRPLDRDLLKRIPAECRVCVAAYGYALVIPPGILKEQFEILSSAT